MLQSSIPLGTVKGIRIGIHYTWFVIFALIVITLMGVFQSQHPGWSPSAALATATFTSLLFFASIVLHELGHSLVAIHYGIPVRSITLFIFGGMAQTEKDADTPWVEFAVAIAGPVVSFALAFLFGALKGPLGTISPHLGAMSDWLATINWVVAVFNLLPGFPLDGGRVFRAIVWGLTRDASKGMLWAVAAGKGLAYGLLFLGVLVVFTTGLLLNGLWLAAIGWFLLTAAEASGRDFVLRRIMKNVKAKDIMRHEVPLVPSHIAIQDWIHDYVLRTGQRAFLVEEGGHIIGLITLADANRIPRERWAEVEVYQAMTPLARLYTVTPDTPLLEVVKLMDEHSLNQIPVMIGDRVAGWIDRARLVETLQLHVQLAH